MPKDHNKQSFRGIGFVTFAMPESVEKILATKHWLNGQEVAIDRAMPKDEPTALKAIFTRVPAPSTQRRSFDNGAGIIGPGLTSVTLAALQHQLSQQGPGAAAAATAAAAMAAAAALASSLDQQGGAVLVNPTSALAHGRTAAHMHAYGQLRSLSAERQESPLPEEHSAAAVSGQSGLAGSTHTLLPPAQPKGGCGAEAANCCGAVEAGQGSRLPVAPGCCAAVSLRQQTLPRRGSQSLDLAGNTPVVMNRDSAALPMRDLAAGVRGLGASYGFTAGSLSHQAMCTQQALGLRLGLGPQAFNAATAAAAAAAAAAATSAVQTLARVQQQQQQPLQKAGVNGQALAVSAQVIREQLPGSCLDPDPTEYGIPSEVPLLSPSPSVTEDVISGAQHLSSLAAGAVASSSQHSQGMSDPYYSSLLSSKAAAVAAAGLRAFRGDTNHLNHLSHLDHLNHLGPAAFGSMALGDAVMHGAAHGSAAATLHQLIAAASVAHSSRRSLDSASATLKRLEGPGFANGRAGPRLFIGKLSKEVSEVDVKEYFMQFGYVMDVYMPKTKDNKQEHRGFGFVTFETEAAIQRVVSHGSHTLKGSTVAIDIAMPKVDEEVAEGMDEATAAAAAVAQSFLGNASGAALGMAGLMPKHM